MADPTSSASAAFPLILSFSFLSLQDGIDGESLIAAFAGAVVFALHSDNERVYKRLLYMIVSIPLGYLIAPYLNEVQMKYTHVSGVPVCSFFSAAGIVKVSKTFLDKIDEFNPLEMIFKEVSKLIKDIKSKKGDDK